MGLVHSPSFVLPQAWARRQALLEHLLCAEKLKQGKDFSQGLAEALRMGITPPLPISYTEMGLVSREPPPSMTVDVEASVIGWPQTCPKMLSEAPGCDGTGFAA